MTPTPIYTFAKWKIKAGNLETVMTMLKELRAKTTGENGNLFYNVHQSVTDPNTLVLMEGYVSEEAQKEHVNSDHYKKLAAERIVPLLDEREVTLVTPLEI